MKIDTAGFIQKQLESIFNSNEYIKAIQDMVIALEREAKIAPNEKTIETRFDQYLTLIFDQLFYSQDILYRPIKEESVNTVRAVSKGRADTSVGNVVIEFKQPKTLSSAKDQESALVQLSEYLEGFNADGKRKLLEC